MEYIIANGDIVIDISSAFMKFTGYTYEELIGKTLIEVSCMLRIDSQVCLGDIISEHSCFMFTKECEPREVNISCKACQSENEKVYYFMEKFNSRISEEFRYLEQILKDNEIGVAIHSYPDLILLRANQKYLDYGDYPYNKKENSIGKSLKETLTGYVDSNANKVFRNIIETGTSFYAKEVKYDHLKRGITYWDTSLIPIYIEGKIKFIIENSTDVTERVVSSRIAEEKTRLKEKNIKEQKEELEAILENMYDGVYVLDKDLNVTASNRRIREFLDDPNKFNKVADLLKTVKIYDFEDNLITLDNMPSKRVFRGEKAQDLRFTVYRSDGVLYLSLNESPIYDDYGAISKVIVSIRDITEQVKKNQLVKKQNDMLNAIIENISDELVIVDEYGQYTMANKAFRDSLSIGDLEQIAGENIMNKAEFYDIDWNLIPYENLPSQRIARGEKFSRFRINNIYKNGTIVHYESSGTPIYDNEGNFIVGVLVKRNISDRLRNEENKLMKVQYDLLSRTIDNLNLNSTLVSYPDTKIKYINKNAFSYLNKLDPKIDSIDLCIGEELCETFKYNLDEKAAIDKRLKELIANKESSFIINKKSFIEGKESFHKFIFQPLYNLNKEVNEVAIIGIDMTEEIEAKNKMEETLKIQDEIFTNVSHELKTPLNVIYSTVQLMEMYFKNSSMEANREKLPNNINIIKQNCYRFTRLINNIVDTSKVKSGFLVLSLFNENIVDVVEDIVQSVSEYVKGKGINIIFDTNTEEKVIACDSNKIERIMLNLISNAVKFSNKDNNIYVSLLDKNGTVEISVRDTGIGMEKKELDRIFNRFHQVDRSLSRNAEGSGIGLYLVKSFVEMHGGRISVDSKIGEGTIFKIELPSRTIEEEKIDKMIPINNKVEMINIEFSDIYSI